MKTNLTVEANAFFAAAMDQDFDDEGQIVIFVFGSNLKGLHGGGAARTAYLAHGAIKGQGEGLQGTSYAIPTKYTLWQTMPLEAIKQAVERFMKFAEANPHMDFHVTRIGCGLAGYKDEQIAPMFETASMNCFFDTQWKEYLPHHLNWGTY